MKTVLLTIIGIIVMAGAMSLAMGAITITPLKEEFTVDRPFLDLVNEHRASKSKKPLQETTELNKLAMKKCKDMRDRDYYDHADPDGKFIWEELKEYKWAGENISLGNEATASELIQGWINSPAHEKTMTSEKYQYVGHAVCKNPDNSWYGVQEFKGL